MADAAADGERGERRARTREVFGDSDGFEVNNEDESIAFPFLGARPLRVARWEGRQAGRRAVRLPHRRSPASQPVRGLLGHRGRRDVSFDRAELS